MEPSEITEEQWARALGAVNVHAPYEPSVVALGLMWLLRVVLGITYTVVVFVTLGPVALILSWIFMIGPGVIYLVGIPFVLLIFGIDRAIKRI